MWQAEHVATLLAQHDVSTQIVPLVSSGDVDMRPIDGKRQVGVFTKRIQQALIDDEADVAVHSLKDLPTEVDERLTLAAVPERENVADCLVSSNSWTLDELPKSAKVGTGSKRRAAQLLFHRSDLRVEQIRGNVQTRLAKLSDGEYDAIMLANAGVMRLEMDDLARCVLPLAQMLPAPGQGALAIEVRSDNPIAIELVGKINDRNARAAVTAERTLLSNLNGGCLAPIAAFANCDDSQIQLDAVVLAPDGTERLSQSGHCDLDSSDDWNSQAVGIAREVSDRLVDAGAKRLVDMAR